MTARASFDSASESTVKLPSVVDLVSSLGIGSTLTAPTRERSFDSLSLTNPQLVPLADSSKGHKKSRSTSWLKSRTVEADPPDVAVTTKLLQLSDQIHHEVQRLGPYTNSEVEVKHYLEHTDLYTIDSMLFDMREQVRLMNKIRKMKVGETVQRKKERRNSLGGNILSLDINQPKLDTEGHRTAYSKNNLNRAMSFRREDVCEQCGSTKTPEWRKGPTGVRSLCNACGLYYSKLVKKYGLESAKKVMREKKESGDTTIRKIRQS